MPASPRHPVSASAPYRPPGTGGRAAGSQPCGLHSPLWRPREGSHTGFRPPLCTRGPLCRVPSPRVAHAFVPSPGLLAYTHGGQATAPHPTQSLSSPPAPGPGQASPLHLAGSAPCPSANPPHPQSSGPISTPPSSSALLWAFPSPSCSLGGARGPCGSVEEGVFCATSSHSGLNSKGVLLRAPLPAPPLSPRFLRAEVLVGFLPTFLLANMLLAPQKNQATVSHFSGALMFLEVLFPHTPG